MRTFYIFDIRDEYLALYYNYEISIYHLLKQFYNLNKDNMTFAKCFLNQLVKPIDKEYLDRRIFIKLHKDIPYIKRGNIHIYNNFYFGSTAMMEIRKLYIKINSNIDKDYKYFFKSLVKEKNNLFACDFENNDYFFIKNVIIDKKKVTL